MKYRVIIRGQKADFERTIECDGIEFRNSWWAVFYRDGWIQRLDGRRVAPGELLMSSETTIAVPSVVVAAIPSEHLNLIEKVEEP